MSKEKLFQGEPLLFGGLSNEKELAKVCPQEFRDINNPWSGFAMDCFYSGADTKNWKWKSPDKEVRRKQLNCLQGLLGTFELSHQDKMRVAGWMLSEMLVEIPEHVPAKKE